MTVRNSFTPLKFLVTLSLLCLFIFTSYSFAQQSYRATILRVSDGDTVWVLMMHGQRVKLRLLGIDTPEKFRSRKLYRDAAYCGVSPGYMKNLGQMATHHAKQYLYRSEKVKVIVYGIGYYGRTLAIVYLPDGTNYNEAMVADGYACVYKYHGHKSRQLPEWEWEKLNSLLEQAKEGRKGLWGKDFKVMDCLCR